MTDRAADSRARERALDPSRSFIVQAPAGSGKTELLVRRFLVLLARVARPEAVLAITFTRKAAGEMRERVVSALREASSAQEPESSFARERFELARAVLARSAERDWHLLENPSRLQIFTIDGLCARLASALPLLSRLGPRSEAVEDATVLYAEAAQRTLAAAAESEIGVELELLLERAEMRVGRLAEQIVYMLARRDQWTTAALKASGDGAEILLESVETGFHAAIVEELGRLAALLPSRLHDRIYEVARLTRAEFAQAGRSAPWPGLGETAQLGDGVDSVSAWRELASLLLTKSAPQLRKKVDKSLGAPPKSRSKDAYSELLDELRKLEPQRLAGLCSSLSRTANLPLSPNFEAAGRAALLAFFKVLLRAHAELWNVFREHGKVDFIEVSSQATNALGAALNPSELLEWLDRRIEHILVDEFQDTSLGQCGLIDLLSAGWEQGDGRTLFLVGDPMQSIYRFRKAEVGIFLAARSGSRRFAQVDLQPLSLSVNFRSDAAVVDWVNEVFPPLMGERDDAAAGVVAYSPSVPAPGAVPGEKVDLVLWKDDGGGARGDVEARGLAQLLVDELLPQARARGGEIAVLVRVRAHAEPLMNALRRLGEPFRSGRMDRLGARPVVYDLQSLARSLLHSGDRLSWMALLRSPMVGLGSSDLCELIEPDVAASVEARRAAVRSRQEPAAGAAEPARTDERAQALRRPRSPVELMADNAARAGLGDEARQRLQRCAEVMAVSRAELGKRPFDEIVRGAWIALGGPLCTDRRGLLDAGRFFELLAELDIAGTVDADEVERRLVSLDAGLDTDPSIVLEFLTVHGAKGLEFDTVILPRLDGGVRGNEDPPLAYETDAGSGRMALVAPAKARGRSSDDDAKRALIQERERQRQDAETLRLLYVAATRAKHRLLLSATESLDRDGERKAAPAATLLGTLGAEVAGLVELREAPAAPVAATGSAASHDGYRLRLGAAAPSPPSPIPVKVFSTTRPSQPAGAPLGPLATSMLAVHVGVAVHEFLERIALDGLDRWPLEQLAAQDRRIERALRAQGVAPAEIESARLRVSAALRGTLEDEHGRWILGRHEESHCEWRLTAMRDGVLTNASIDRSFVCEGVRWIVDYKTGGPRGLDGEAARDDAASAYIAAHIDQYRGQLQEYRSLVADAGAALSGITPGLPIRVGLYFVELPAGLRWQPEENWPQPQAQS